MDKESKNRIEQVRCKNCKIEFVSIFRDGLEKIKCPKCRMFVDYEILKYPLNHTLSILKYPE